MAKEAADCASACAALAAASKSKVVCSVWFGSVFNALLAAFKAIKYIRFKSLATLVKASNSNANGSISALSSAVK